MVVDAGKLWISRRDQVMRPYMARAGTWEPEEGRVLMSLTKPGCRFLDIGANIGYFSVLVHTAAAGVQVDAVEPDPTNVRVLRFNLWFNEVSGTVWPLALDDTSRALHLSDNEHNLGDLRTGRVEGGGGQAEAKWIVPAAQRRRPVRRTVVRPGEDRHPGLGVRDPARASTSRCADRPACGSSPSSVRRS